MDQSVDPQNTNNRHKKNFLRQTRQILGDVPRIKIRENLSEAEAFAVERLLITTIGRYPTGPLVNRTDGGEGASGCIPSKALRARVSANSKAMWATKTKEERMAIHKIMLNAHTPEERSETQRQANLSVPPEKRRERARKALAAITSEQRQEGIRKMTATFQTPKMRKQSSELAKKRLAQLTPRERSEIARKGAASQTPEQRRAKARKGAATKRANAAKLDVPAVADGDPTRSSQQVPRPQSCGPG